jgi:hypothetical protein
MNPLEQYPNVRRYVYAGMWLVGLVLTAAQIGVAAIDGAQQPAWLTVALAVFPAVAAYVGYTAQQNVGEDYTGEHRAEEGMGGDAQPLIARHFVDTAPVEAPIDGKAIHEALLKYRRESGRGND